MTPQEIAEIQDTIARFQALNPPATITWQERAGLGLERVLWCLVTLVSDVHHYVATRV